ncbi:ABC transporter substrate-binding protein [Hoeflea sp.]|uniref:ABC transporter substrate-binding protein n=1 Tax=Hoeflea sp. TaxID=1940281 RepID=UPI0037493171
MKKMLLLSAAAAALTMGAAHAADLKFTPGEGDFNWESYEGFASANDYNGQSVTIAGPWLAGEAVSFENLLAYFEEATGADVRYVGSDSLEQQIVIDAEAGSAPNIAVFPQPGLATTMAARGFLSPLGAEAASWVGENYAAGQSWVDLGTYPDKDGTDQFFGFFFNVNVKSLVWYVPENFEDAGYEVPKSMEELKALTEQIVADGETPWCIGLGSGGATGWPATDWVEDMMLRTQAPDVYDKWVSNEVKFTDPAVIGAIEEFGWFARNDAFVAGGADAVATTDFRDSPKGLFSSPPQCYLHRQASFIPAYFPDGTVVGQDADFFYFPAYAGKDLGKPVLGAGTLMGITKDNEATRGFIEFLKTPFAHEVMMAQPGFLTPLKSVNPANYLDDTQRALGDVLLGATTFRFDGSDLMPGGVGAGSFWTGMVDYTGGKSAEEVADSIQKSWDSLK